MLLRPGEVIVGQHDTYTIAATINRGAYGCAFRARTADGEWRVVKQYEPSEELSPEDQATQRRYFIREAEIVCRHRCPRMVRGYELIEHGSEIILVMEHVQGQTLRTVLDQQLLDHHEPFDAGTVLTVGAQLCDAIQTLHELPGQLIYRDLKPSNIMWDAVERTTKLIDLGAARYNQDDQQATQGLGTEGYAPPELYHPNATLSPATDVYTIGAVLYELATGQVPPAKATPTDFRGSEERLPEALRNAILVALQQDPAARFPSARALAEALASTGEAPARPGWRVPPNNHHPLLACYCPVCGREPDSDLAIYCGHCGKMYAVAMMRIVPRHRPATTAYLDRKRVTLGRNDPRSGQFPELDLTSADPGRHVSRRHLTLLREGTGYEVEVHTTQNPTRLDGRPLEPEQRYPAGPGSRLELADLVATLLVKPVLDIDGPAEEGA